MTSVNLVVPKEQNDLRKKLGITWREVLVAGLATLEGKPVPDYREIDPIKENLKQAATYIKAAWDGINRIK